MTWRQGFWNRDRPVRSVFRMVAVAVLAIGMVAAAWIGYEVWRAYPREDRLANVGTLVEQFDRVALRDEDSPEAEQRLDRWSGRVRIRITGDPDRRWRPVVERYADTLRMLTGLEILVFLIPGTTENLFVSLVEQDRMLETVSQHAFDWRKYRETIKKSDCFFWYSHEYKGSSRITKALVVIRRDASDSYISYCFASGIAASFGLTNGSNLIRPSIFDTEYYFQKDFSVNDRIIIRTLFDSRLRPGMPRGEALKVAREVIAELHAKVLAGKPITLTAD